MCGRYGFDTDVVDEEGNYMAQSEAVSADSELQHVLGSNSNKARVQEAHKQQVSFAPQNEYESII
jgi:hypothetical protein